MGDLYFIVESLNAPPYNLSVNLLSFRHDLRRAAQMRRSA
jgi:hypothetical protein